MIAQQQEQLEVAAPKVHFAEVVGKGERSLGLREAAATLDMTQSAFVSCLLSDGYCYREQGSGATKPYGQYVGVFFEQKYEVINGMPRYRLFVLAEGLARFVEQYTEL